ncbi:MAG: UvrD-helicase domain-containing protein [Deltaproteobacteria bacterium]|nr:UvrD-helicase domain-containing protein [Deltaproteobacteria bacterium]
MINGTDSIPDLKEREEALDPSRSFIVQAPAGSGKTELLMQRFLRLLAIVERPEQILAITFTRKAAGEMQSRIIQALQSGKEVLPPSERPNVKKTHELAKTALKRDSEMGWNLLENPGRLRVQTIDSLCSSLTRQMPLLSHLGRQPSITETPDELYREASRQTILMVEKDGRTGDSVRKALRHLDNSVQGLEDRLVIMLQKRDQWLRHVNREVNEDDLRELLEGSVRRLVEDSLEKAKEELPGHLIDDLTVSARYAASNLLKEGNSSRISCLTALHNLPDTVADNLPIWQGITELLLTKEGEWRKPGGINKKLGFPADKTDDAKKNKEMFQGLLTTLSDNERLREALAVIPTLPGAGYDEEEWQILDALLHLLPVAERRLKKVFGEEGVVDFAAIAISALNALGTDDNPTDLMLSLDYRIQHILADEYQDTSRTQLELVKALTRGWEPHDGRTLFIVGDPMQSIYLFREAVVGLFLEARNIGVGHVELHPLTLTSNFRSQQKIVEWVNETFQDAFPEIEDSLTGAISYAPFEATHPPLDGTTVDLRLFRERDDIREAEEISGIIKEIDRSGESVAILVRSRPHLGEIVKRLKKEGIEFKSEEIDPLIDRPVVQDLFSLLRSLMHPCDRAAWLAILRAPWCGLTLSDIHKLCLGDRETPVWALMNDQDRITSISEDGQRRLSMISRRLSNALRLWGRVSPRVLLEGLWVELGGPACIDDSSMKDADAFFEMLDSVSTGGEVGSMGSLEFRIKTLYASPSGRGEKAVEIMTIHKAKGLEFDHVILPGLAKPTRGRDKKLLLWLERGEDLLLAPIDSKGGDTESAIYRYMDGVDALKEDLERTRLFYVAATRARKRLYLFGDVKVKDTGEISVQSRSLLSCIQHIIIQVPSPSPSPPPVKVGENTYLRLRRLPSSWELPEPARPVEVDSKGAETASISVEPEFNWAGEAVKHLGTVVHKYLCRMAGEGLSEWNDVRVSMEKERMTAMLCQLGLNKGEAEETAKKGIDILIRTIKDEVGRWSLENHPEGHSELPITGVIEGKVIHAVIDRTFVDNDIRWIIDYKTSLHEGGKIEAFLEEEKERYRKQLKTYAELLKASGEKREIRKGLYYPALSAWVELTD